MAEGDVVRDGGAVLSEEAERQKKDIADAKASMEKLLEHEQRRRRNRWFFYGALGFGLLFLLPFIALYIALVIKLATSVA